MKPPQAPKKRVRNRKLLEVEYCLAQNTEEKTEALHKLMGDVDNPLNKTEQKYMDKLTSYIDDLTTSMDNTFKVFEVEATLDGKEKQKRYEWIFEEGKSVRIEVK